MIHLVIQSWRWEEKQEQQKRPSCGVDLKASHCYKMPHGGVYVQAVWVLG